jgi:hypothetical protein
VFLEAGGISLEMRVVVRVLRIGVELVDREAPALLVNSFAIVPSSTASTGVFRGDRMSMAS